ncbi:MAG: hypothetical protein R3A78_15060 [Polyangiales bacterium]
MCLVGCLAFFFPRLALFLVWFFNGGYLSRAIQPWYWLLLGFFFMPTTVLAFAYASNSLGTPGDVPPLGWLLIAIAVFIDLGLTGSNQRHWRNRRDRDH